MIHFFKKTIHKPEIPYIMRALRTCAQVAELVDALVSGTSAARRGGSSPLLGTTNQARRLREIEAFFVFRRQKRWHPPEETPKLPLCASPATTLHLDVFRIQHAPASLPAAGLPHPETSLKPKPQSSTDRLSHALPAGRKRI